MGKTYINPKTVKKASYVKNDTSGMYGYLDKGYTVHIKHLDESDTIEYHKSKSGAKKACKSLVK